MDARSDSIGWGILATGKIAHSFCRDLALVPDGHVAAVGSRHLASAEDFASAFGGRPYGSYEEMVADPGVDVVYVATPHVLHADGVRMAFEAGKPVLCEKPMTLDAATTAALVAEAADRGLFLMEAMWTACHPMVRKVRELVAGGEYGRPGQLVADLGFTVQAPPGDRLLDPALGASALLDMGIYPLTFAHLLLGPPERTTAVAQLSDGGIDLAVAISLAYASGATAALTASMTAWTPRAATLATDRGRFDIAAEFHHPTRVTFTPYDASGARGAETIEPDEPIIGVGYGNEIAEVHRCLREGLLESPLVPHEQTLALLTQMDAIREQVGVRFPG
ncbi:MAG TPA: Gfo/Idh/MocA family oxidoreductase [Marmoricola sp.]|nr:Gfo/Idh/MocA family oxidoreductase [Marmoricola sp.]